MSLEEQEMIRGRAITVSGKPTFIFGGEIHYFRITPGEWEDRIRKGSAAFLNTIGSYIPWNFHEPEERNFNFEEEHDLRKWIFLIREERLYFFARPGPYICSEWDMGGLPGWLIGKECIVRTVDPKYMESVSRWFRAVNGILGEFLPEKDGNLILYQIENELIWGEMQYMRQMADWARRDGINVPLITNLNPDVRKNTEISDSLDLYPGPWNIHKPEAAITDLLEEQPSKISACVEFQVGFAAETGTPFPTMNGSIPKEWVEVNTKNSIARGLNLINFYMFCGGTTFGYYTGRRDVTSYDYESAIHEWGELDDKYYMIRRIGSFIRSFGDFLVKTLPSQDLIVDAPRGVSVLQRRSGEHAFVFPRNLTRHPAEITFRLSLPGGQELTVPSAGSVRIQPQSMKILPVDVPLSDTLRLVYSTSEIFGIYHHDNGITLVVYALPGETGEIMIGGFDRYDHVRGDAVVERAGENLLVRFLHNKGCHHVRLMERVSEDSLLKGHNIRIIVSDTETAGKNWPGIRDGEEFPILSNIYFMDKGFYENSILRLPVSLIPEKENFMEFPCHINPILPAVVTLDGEELAVKVDKILDTVRVEMPTVPAPDFPQIPIEWRMNREHIIALQNEKEWKPYRAFLGNERSGEYSGGYYAYRCSFDFSGNPSGMKLELTEIHDNADIFLNGLYLNGVYGVDNNGPRLKVDTAGSLVEGHNELLVLVENEGHPRKGDDATFTGITGPVVLAPKEQNLPLREWKRGFLSINSESALNVVPEEAGKLFDDRCWESIEVKKGWDSRIVLPPSSTHIEKGYERVYAVYRTNFMFPGNGESHGVILDVPKSDGKCWIYCNGHEIDKKHQERFTVDLTPHTVDGENQLTLIIRNFRWYTTLGLFGQVEIRFVEKVIRDGWEFIRGLRGQNKGYPEEDILEWPLLEGDSIPNFSWLGFSFTHEPNPGWTEPLCLELNEWDAKILIYLNGILIGRSHPDGPQERFYLPGDYMKKENRIVLFCNSHAKTLKVGKTSIYPYYQAKEGMLEIRF
jgi:beta-galactosidase